MSGLDNRVVAVTGAAGGVGRATALALARAGARLALTDLQTDGLQQTLDAVKATGTQAVSVAGDVTQADTHDRLLAAALDAFGSLSGLCNVAGVLGAGTLAEATPEQFDRVMHVNCLAQLLAAQRMAPALKKSGHGAIVNVSSVGGLAALPLMTVYCASKSAVIGLTRALALELAPGVRCNALCPGGIDTPMSQGLLASVPDADRPALVAQLTGKQLIPRFATPEEIASAIVFLVSDASAFITGATIAADGGFTAW